MPFCGVRRGNGWEAARGSRRGLVDNFGTVHCRGKAVTGAGLSVDPREIRQGKKHRQRSWKRTGSSRVGAPFVPARSYRTKGAQEALGGRQRRSKPPARGIRPGITAKRGTRLWKPQTGAEAGGGRHGKGAGRKPPNSSRHRAGNADRPPPERPTPRGPRHRHGGRAARKGGREREREPRGGRPHKPAATEPSRERRRKGPAGGPRAKGPRAPQCATSGPNHARWERPEHDGPRREAPKGAGRPERRGGPASEVGGAAAAARGGGDRAPAPFPPMSERAGTAHPFT